MKTLYVLRHGQAAPETDGVTDHQRELTRRGRAEVELTAQSLGQRGNLPSLVLSSSAARARDTAERAVAAWPTPPPVVIVDELYLAEPDAYVDALQQHGGQHEAAMVVGHNPGLEALVILLTQRSEHLATASLVQIELMLETWAELSLAARGQGRLVHAFRP